MTQLSQASVESDYEVVRPLNFKVLRTIQTINIKIVDELLGTSRQVRGKEKGDCEADELTANKGETIRIGHLKTLKQSNLKTL